MENSNRLIEEIIAEISKELLLLSDSNESLAVMNIRSAFDDIGRFIESKIRSSLEKVRQETLKVKEKEINEALQQQREEMKKEILKIGEHFVKFGEKKGVEAIDMVLAVINPQQPGESKK